MLKNQTYISSISFTGQHLTFYFDKAGRLLLKYSHTNTSDTNYYLDDNGQDSRYDLSDPYVDYYSDADYKELRGKLKRVGPLEITYYDRFDWDELKGKVKSIGNVKFTYYDRFDWDELRGKIKSVGDMKITYYNHFDWDELNGKIKAIGNTSFTYYDRFDPNYKIGRLENITGNTQGLNIIKLHDPFDRYD
ncbi:hypothetical protein ACFQZX_16470 [Mucilaginibacter litoreus]|uniref:YD repeat-containing protein n=1 Tax=Mucilaginibacter litoreus TaxID=1048221 RepID=A0ABW3AWN9_9SPHI